MRIMSTSAIEAQLQIEVNGLLVDLEDLKAEREVKRRVTMKVRREIIGVNRRPTIQDHAINTKV